MKGIKFNSIQVRMDGKFMTEEIDIGGVVLNCKGREYMLDSISYIRSYYKGTTIIQIEVEEDRETFECKYDLTVHDLILGQTIGTFYLSMDGLDSLVSISLAVKYGELKRIIKLKLD